jgi:AIR synthase-related protein
MLQEIIDKVMANQSVIDKINIAGTHLNIGNDAIYVDPLVIGKHHVIPIGDDCAAIPDGQGGYLLFAAEGMISSFAEALPWFAGYSAVMVNISDVCAMGGLPLAATDVIWIKDESHGQELWAGMQAASKAYGVPIVGGHTCYRSESKHLAVSILGKADKLLTSYDAKHGDTLMIAIDMNGSYYENYPFWNASTTATHQHLQQTIKLMHELAERDLSTAAKDISMGGIVGTLAMLMHTSKVGACIELEKIPKPDGVNWEKWLVSFPSFGYLFTCQAENIEQVITLFSNAAITCKAIGEITSGKTMTVNYQQEEINIELN